MSRSQCVCGDCAESYGHISPVSSNWEEVSILHTQTKKAEAAGLDVGDECELDHDHDQSKSCEVQYKCECGELYAYASEASECCIQWECNFCGYVHSDSGWSWGSSAKENAAECCAQTCDECGAYGWPDYISEHECNSGMGLRKMLPWEERGIKVDATAPAEGREWKEVWEFEPSELDVVQAAADYYLLEAMKAGLVGTIDAETETIFSEEKMRDVELVKPNSKVANHTLMRIVRDEAEEMFNNLVRTWDPILQSYTHMACGGELRHHVAVGGSVLNSDRDTAWSGWKRIFDVVGPDALTDAADLFLEFTGGSFGGEPWADACRILHARVTGKISPALFLDRIFNAQHNGGVLLNKVNWKGEAQRHTTGEYLYSINELQSRVLPAHGSEPEPDYSTLLAYASGPVQRLFADMHEFGRRARLDMGMTLAGLPTRPPVGTTVQGEYARRLAKQQAEQAAYAKLPASAKLLKEVAKWQKMIEQYTPYAEAEAKANAAWQVKVDAGDPDTICGCGAKGCYIPGASTYYTNIVKKYKEDVRNGLKKAAKYEQLEAAGASQQAISNYANVW